MNKFLYSFLITLISFLIPIKTKSANYIELKWHNDSELTKLLTSSTFTFGGRYYNFSLNPKDRFTYLKKLSTTPAVDFTGNSSETYTMTKGFDYGYKDETYQSEYRQSAYYANITPLEITFEEDPSTISETVLSTKKYRAKTIVDNTTYYLDRNDFGSVYIPGYNSVRETMLYLTTTPSDYIFTFYYQSQTREINIKCNGVVLYMTFNSSSYPTVTLTVGCNDSSKYSDYTLAKLLVKQSTATENDSDIKFGTYNNESNKEYSVNSLLSGNYKLNIVCPTSGSQELPLYFTKTDSHSVTFPSSMTGVTMTDYTPSNYTTSTAAGKKMTITPEAAGKSYSLSYGTSYVALSNDTVFVNTAKTLTLNFVSQDQVYWTYNGTKLTDNKLELNYINANTSTAPLRLTSSLSHRYYNTPKSPSNLLKRMPLNGKYFWTLANIDKLDFSDKSSYTETIQPATNEEFVNIFGAFPALNLTVRPYKPTLTLTAEQTMLSHDNGDFTIEIPQGSFEAGSGTNMYARVLLIPQFDAFGTEEDAIEALGGAPREGIKDTWLDHSWYKENNLAGYLPEMQWDATNKKYTCRITPENMTFMDWQGNKTTGHRLVSGHYKVQIVPCEGTNSHQYGIVASDLVDLYITPSAKDMAMYLCVKGADGQPTWKEYVMDNTNLSFEGPKADDHGETAYRHTRLVPNSDYSEVWVESSRHRPADQDEKDFHPNKVGRRAAARATEVVRGSLDGYTKVEPDDFVDLSGVNSANIKLVKNGVASEAQTISVSKSGDNIITGIEDVAADAYDSESEYYTTSGIRVSAPLQPGIYIERRANGRSRKITVK